MKFKFFKSNSVSQNIFLFFIICVLIASCTTENTESDENMRNFEKGINLEMNELVSEAKKFGDSFNHSNPDFNSIKEEDLQGTLLASINLIISFGQ